MGHMVLMTICAAHLKAWGDALVDPVAVGRAGHVHLVTPWHHVAGLPCPIQPCLLGLQTGERSAAAVLEISLAVQTCRPQQTAQPSRIERIQSCGPILQY